MPCGCQLDLDLCLPVGTAPSWAFTVTDPDNADARVNITGATFAFYVKSSPRDADVDAIFTLTSAGGDILITNATQGEAQIDNDAVKSALLTPDRVYSWSLRATFASGETRTIRKGQLHAETA